MGNKCSDLVKCARGRSTDVEQDGLCYPKIISFHFAYDNSYN